uniref:Uncharacterized protein n=1 Tax=Arundo donax TaxID=35708 RepID=A0A0A8YPY7_ARUDO
MPSHNLTLKPYHFVYHYKHYGQLHEQLLLTTLSRIYLPFYKSSLITTNQPINYKA